MRVLHVASECYPLLKTGGLADVVGALPAAQCAEGADARVLLPGFPGILGGLVDGHVIAELPGRFGAHLIRLWLGHSPLSSVPVYVIDAPGLFDRAGNPYADFDQRPYEDNHRRFALLGWMAVQLATGVVGDWQPEVLHAHDWHAGLTAAYLQQARKALGHPIAASIITVHNLAYQGLFPADRFGELGLPWEFFGVEGAEFHGQVSFLKAGLYFSDRIATVSPTYAREIQTAEHSCGLEGLLRTRRADLVGILNGVDYTLWDPAKDPAIDVRYDASRLAGKARCKAALQAQLGLGSQPDALLFAAVTRLTEQKGLHLLVAGARHIVNRGGQLVVLGNGDEAIEGAFRNLMGEYPGQIAVRFSFDEHLSHRIFAGADVMLVPSRFEPCGLTQLYGLRYGSLPLVRRTGGLADTVVDCSLENLADETATGFVFNGFDQTEFDAAVRRAFALASKPTSWREVRKQAMAQRFDWQGPAQAYLGTYRAALGG